MSADPAKELVDVINEDGQIVATVTRQELRRRRLPHRCVYVLLFNHRGELFIHLRTAQKDAYPSHWDVTIGGVLGAGESYRTGFERETREELGIEIQGEELFIFRYADDATIVHGMVYRAVHDGPFRLQPEEIVQGEFVPLDTVAARVAGADFCPDGLAVLAEYQRRFRTADSL